ncbi:C2 domain-containing protein 5-like isoform X2 [Clavelina lepadiformis]|uniref:C2 domain-containing protein 5-like isoform X2 n=1 Tax=Clavelina lepadiformis TaxID=159417 RepID=UPI0040417E0F
MPGRLKVRIIAGRHLPVMDRASELTDAFVEVKFGSLTYKTEVFPKSLNPTWNSEWFKFEVDDEHLQDEPLQIRVLDHDTYSAHDAIGKIYIDIDPLLDDESSHVLCGWFPVYDTMHGIRGEILLTVKLELFADANQFKQSSCGFKFICGVTVPECYRIKYIHGFVHEFLVNEDPEYKWIDKLRTPRATNEARQRLFSKMTGELQRRIGRKVENMGGNAVLGYQQQFDIEEDSGIVVRGIGTAVTIETRKKSRKKSTIRSASSSPDKLTKEFPFYTMKSFPPRFLSRLSIAVNAHSVKLLEKIHTGNSEDVETRDSWWNELRQEIKGHCHALACNAVIGYTEHASICDDVVILSAQGTAATVNPLFCPVSQDKDENCDDHFLQVNFSGSKRNSTFSESTVQSLDEDKENSLLLFEVPKELTELVCPMKCQPSPLNPNILVPDMLFTTVHLPNDVQYIGKGTVVQARFCRSKKKGQGEPNAALVSEFLPFIEYELHKRLYNKVKIRGMNALFGLESKITLGENIVVGVATGTAVCLAALPKLCQQSASVESKEPSTSSLEARYTSFTRQCVEVFQLKQTTEAECDPTSNAHPHLSPSPRSPLSLSMDDKRSLVIGIDEFSPHDDDDEFHDLLLNDSLPPPHCYISNMDICPGLNESLTLTQMFSLLWRVRYDDDANDKTLNEGLTRCCEQAMKTLWFRLRRNNPVCFIAKARFLLVLADDDELQIWITGAALIPDTKAPKDSNKKISFRNSAPVRAKSGLLQEPDLAKEDDVESNDEGAMLSLGLDARKFSASFISRPLSPLYRKLKRTNTVGSRNRYDSTSSGASKTAARNRHFSEGGSSISDIDHRDLNEASEPVEITPMSYMCDRATVRHIGVLNMFIIRETTAVRGSDEEIPSAEPAHGTGCSWFVSRSLTETNALIRAHVVALGGNALTSYKSSHCVLKESLAKNEAQCLIHVSGDVVLID